MLDKYLELCYIVEDIPILKGYAAIVLKILMKYIDNEFDRHCIQRRINNIKPCNKHNDSMLLAVKEKLKVQTDLWFDELRDLQASSSDMKRQLELAINCVQENKWLDPSFEKFVNIRGKLIRASSINPRLFFDENYGLVTTDISSENVEKVISLCGMPLLDCDTNLFVQTVKTGIYPILYSSYYFNKGMQINDKKIMLYDRDELCCKSMELSDQSFEILDDPVECSLELLTPYPEHQVMTRFMYPNPRLIKSKKL
jgi:hypothetical protein